MPRLNSVDSLFTAKLEKILEVKQLIMKNPSLNSIISWGRNVHTIEIIDKKKLL